MNLALEQLELLLRSPKFLEQLQLLLRSFVVLIF
jgi:hypothetical protein